MKIVITGLGGQGTVMFSRILAAAAKFQGMDAISTETHGMAQRGGSVISFVKIGNFMSPLIRRGTADCAFCLKESEALRAISYLSQGSPLFVNAPSYSHESTQVFSIDASAESAKLGNPRGANLYLLAYAIPLCPGLPGIEAVREAVRATLKKQLWETNLALIEAAFNNEKNRVLRTAQH